MADLYDEMRNSVLEGDEELAIELAEKVLTEKGNAMMAINEGFLNGIQEAGRLFEEGEYFLPDLIFAADALKSALRVLDSELKKNEGESVKSKKIVLATVQGDIHDIGKTIVGTMMTANGYEVHDLGADVKNEEIIRAVKEIKPEIVGLSALLTTTMEEQKNIITMLEEEGIRNTVKVIVGGAPVNQNWADKIKADGYSDNAISAVKLADELTA